MAEPDVFISTFDEHGNTLDVPYPRENGLPMHPSAVINLHNAGNLALRCAHGLVCEAWYLGSNSTSQHRGSAFICCPRQINHQCRLYFKLNNIYRPLMDIYLSTSSMHRGPYPSPPLTRKRPASVPGPQESPTKHSKRIRTRHSTVAPATSMLVKTNTPLPACTPYQLPLEPLGNYHQMQVTTVGDGFMDLL
ncbi:hypothetical protein F5051DRAFT_446448 [Lentinula edodes]|nr:hypothetical protein F5051DRAFT_446448 [Lentinula edodes]